MKTAADYFELMAEADMAKARAKVPGLKWMTNYIYSYGGDFGNSFDSACIQGICALADCATPELFTQDDVLDDELLEEHGWYTAAYAIPLTRCPVCESFGGVAELAYAGVQHVNDHHGTENNDDASFEDEVPENVRQILRDWAKAEREAEQLAKLEAKKHQQTAEQELMTILTGAMAE